MKLVDPRTHKADDADSRTSIIKQKVCCIFYSRSILMVCNTFSDDMMPDDATLCSPNDSGFRFEIECDGSCLGALVNVVVSMKDGGNIIGCYAKLLMCLVLMFLALREREHEPKKGLFSALPDLPFHNFEAMKSVVPLF